MRTNPTQGFNSRLRERVRAGYAGLVVQSPETERIEAAARKTAKEMDYSFRRWTCTGGWVKNPDEEGELVNGPEAVEQIIELPNQTLFVMHVFDELFEEPLTRQAFKDVLKHAKTARKTILLVGTFELPADLEKEFAPIEFDLPQRGELRALAESLCDSNNLEVPANGSMEKSVDAGLGLTIQEVENAFALSLVKEQELDPEIILDTKKEIVRQQGILEYVDAPETMGDVGGLEALKELPATP
jgi:hypothetical protein